MTQKMLKMRRGQTPKCLKVVNEGQRPLTPLVHIRTCSQFPTSKQMALRASNTNEHLLADRLLQRNDKL